MNIRLALLCFNLIAFGGCALRPLPYEERPIDWMIESNEKYCGKHSPNARGNRGELWHGYYFPNCVMRRQFANMHGMSPCLYDMVVIGDHHLGGIAGYSWPIEKCFEDAEFQNRNLRNHNPSMLPESFLRLTTAAAEVSHQAEPDWWACVAYSLVGLLLLIVLVIEHWRGGRS